MAEAVDTAVYKHLLSSFRTPKTVDVSAEGSGNQNCPVKYSKCQSDF
jgi:hypothetical protein